MLDGAASERPWVYGFKFLEHFRFAIRTTGQTRKSSGPPRASRRAISAAIDRIADLYFAIDVDSGEILDANPAVGAALGVARDALIGVEFNAFVPGDAQGPWWTSLDSLAEGLTQVPDAIEAAFAKFHGDFHQMPPMVSAIKIGGVPLYKLARKGEVVERQTRLVTVFHHQIKGIALPDVEFRVVCSKGFYVRTYCHDIGDALGCGGHMAGLRRTRSGKFTIQGNLTFDELKNLPREQILARVLSLRDVSRLRGA